MDARHRTRSAEKGQVIVLFTLSLVAIIAMATLLFDAANALVLRRQLQDAGDAGALAAANVIQSGFPKGCSATPGSPPGSPRAEVTTAATTAVQSALPGTGAGSIHVSCPGGYDNFAVQVSLDGQSPGYFGGLLGLHGFGVHSTSQALNGTVDVIRYSVVVLDPYNSGWPNGRKGCPSVLISGGPTIVMEGSMQVDSACPATGGGALGTNGNSASVTFNNGAAIRVVGDFVPGPLAIAPSVTTHATYVKDPLAGLTPLPVASLPVRYTTRQVFGGSDVVLQPGVYQGGIQLKNSVKAFLRPGIYVFQGGGLDIGAQNEVYSVGSTVSSTDAAHWAADCPAGSCGVLLYNTGTASGTTAMGPLTVGAGATMKLRPYVANVDGAGLNATEYANLLVWQDASPVPSASYAQPSVQLSGGGTVDLSGAVYAPSAPVEMGGGSGGSGGTATNLTLQFICWDLSFSGNSNFHFYYQSDSFPKPTDYGLIK
jgi:Putative Flp pilus-assembly TadE/G-like